MGLSGSSVYFCIFCCCLKFMNNLGAPSCNIRSNSHLIIPKTGQFKFLSMARVDVAKSGFSRLLQFIWKHKIESGTNLKLKTMCCVIETGLGTKHETFLYNQEKRPFGASLHGSRFLCGIWGNFSGSFIFSWTLPRRLNSESKRKH